MARSPYHPNSKRLLQMGLLAATIAFAGIVTYFSPRLGLIIMSAGVLYVILSKRLEDFVFIFALIACSGAMVAIGIIRFTFLPQALYLLQKGADPWQMVLSFDVWGPRYLLVYPAVLLSQWLDIDLDLAFTVYGLFGMTLLAVLTFYYCDLANFFKNPVERRHIAQAIIGSLWLTVCPFMNGRLMNSFLGITLILYAQAYTMKRRRFTIWSIFLQAMGVFLAMMTSGTMIVAFSQMFIGGFLINKKLPEKHRLHKTLLLFISALSIAGLFPFFYAGILKNRSFFQGSLVMMLAHGLGGVFFVEEGLAVQAELAFFVVGLILLFWGHRLIRRNPALLPAWLTLPLGLVLGLFGYSTMLMFLPSMVIMSVYLTLHVEELVLRRVPQTKENRRWERKILSS